MHVYIAYTWSKSENEFSAMYHTALEKFIMYNKLGRIGLNRNKLKWIIGIQGH